MRIVGFLDSRQPFPINGTRNGCWHFLMSPLRCRDSVSVRITWVYLCVRRNLQVHGYTVVALHLRSIPKGIESKEQKGISTSDYPRTQDPYYGRLGDEESPMDIDSRGAQAHVKDTHFRHRLPLGYNRWFRKEALCRIWMWRSTKGPMAVTTVAYLETTHGIHGKWRITRSLDTTSTPPITTIAWLRLTSRSNTIELCINMERRTREYGLGLTHHGIK
jgi:hypothetical protein